MWLIDLPNGTKQLVVFTSARTGTKPTQNFISTTKAMGIDQFYQRYRIAAKKLTGPTGDPYFSYDYQFIGTLENEDEAKMMRGLYDQYAKSGFITDMADEAADIQTERRTQGGRHDYTDSRRNDDETEIPF